MINHSELNARELLKKIKQKEIGFGGNKKLKIYGTLNCASGKRMKIKHRVFFISEKEALEHGYRPCRNCLHKKYKIWKGNELI
jgi:methylphosphotriester-DNA--protein-cysteine methyltransferase